ncbi:MAG: HD domain-containing protein [Candidatus Methanomethylophilaceae archaeon]|nr:HD domain-containing protein [Candidatus Methanomethylophilaceae archaeon]
MPALNANIMYLFFESANMHRWNDHIRPLDLTELDKQAHKAAIAWVLGKTEESAGNPVSWRKIIENTMFSFIQRSVLTDLKPQVFYKITQEKSAEVNAFIISEVRRSVPDFDSDLLSRFEEFLGSDQKSLEDDIIRAAHYLATRWEFELIYESNRSLYGIDQTRKEISQQIGQFIHLKGVSEILAEGHPYDFIDLVGQLRFQQRWARTPRIPRTSVLGHSLMVADAMYLADVDAKEDERTVYNDFYTALFHDLPEVLTKDVISPIKASIGGLESILQEYEHEQIDNVIMPLLNPDWRDEFRFMVYDPFHDEEGGRFGRRKGYDIKTCDLYAAYMEAMISRSYGVTSNSLAQGETQLREKLMSRKGLDAKALVEGLGKMQI